MVAARQHRSVAVPFDCRSQHSSSPLPRLSGWPDDTLAGSSTAGQKKAEDLRIFGTGLGSRTTPIGEIPAVGDRAWIRSGGDAAANESRAAFRASRRRAASGRRGRLRGHATTTRRPVGRGILGSRDRAKVRSTCEPDPDRRRDGPRRFSPGIAGGRETGSHGTGQRGVPETMSGIGEDRHALGIAAGGHDDAEDHGLLVDLLCICLSWPGTGPVLCRERHGARTIERHRRRRSARPRYRGTFSDWRGAGSRRRRHSSGVRGRISRYERIGSKVHWSGALGRLCHHRCSLSGLEAGRRGGMNGRMSDRWQGRTTLANHRLRLHGGRW